MAPDIKGRSTSDSDSSSNRSSSPAPETEAKSAATANPKTKNGDSDSEDSSSSGSGQDDNSDDDSGSSQDDAAANQQSTNQTQLSAASRPAKAFKPPSGFKPVKRQSPPSSEATSILSNTSGKQVFHITAPSFLPLSKVKEVSLGKVLQGEPVLAYDGVNYGIPPGNMSQGDLSEKKILLYDSKSESYYSAPVHNIPSYHIQEIISVPQTAVNNPDSIPDKPTRKQPKNLKMRFRPLGSSDAPPETIGTSSEESEGEKPAVKDSKSRKEKEERKRKHHHADGEPGVPRKKSKKHSSHETGAVPSSQIDVDEEPRQKKSKKSSKSRDEKKRRKEST